MLKVSIQLHPFGDPEKQREIHALYIANVGGDEKRADYRIWLDQDPRTNVFRPAPDAEIVGFDRHLGAVILLGRAIDTLKAQGKL